MRRLAVAVATVAVMGVSAGSAAAHNVGPFVDPHVHLLTTPNSKVHEVGPDGCATGGLGAFQDFHYHFHVGQPGTTAFSTNPVAVRGAGCP